MLNYWSLRILAGLQILLFFCIFAIKRYGLKILKLHFNNIHSLKGWHTIDFTAPPLSTAGLFAITGPTGAGKSTILDVITLALFNRLPRFDARISVNEIVNSGSIITHFTNEASAEVEYEVGNSRYRSTWSISQNRKGVLKEYEMAVAKLPENEFQTDKKSEVPAFNESVIGLNYEQFVRSILLSQGEFAKFLKSDDKERASLLEKITGTGIYRRLGMAAYYRAQEHKQGLELKKQQIEDKPVFTSDEVKEKTLEIRHATERLAVIHNELAEKTKITGTLEAREKISREIYHTEGQQVMLAEKIKRFEPDNGRLSRHQALDAYRGDLALYRHDTVRYRDILDDIKEAETKIVALESELAASITAMSDLTGTRIDEENFIAEMKRFENEISILDSQIAQLRENGQKEQKKYVEFLENNREHASIQKLKSLPYHSQLEFASGLQAAILGRYPQPANVTELYARITTLREKYNISQKMADESRQRKEQLAEVSRLKAEFEKLTGDITSIEQMKTKTSGDLVACEKNVAQLRAEKEKKIAVAGMEEHRSLLLQGAPCPLCGSTEHPYAEVHLLVDIGKAELELNEAIKQQSLQKEILEKILETLTAARTQKENLENTLAERQKMISQIENNWKTKGAGTPDHEDLVRQSEALGHEVSALTARYEDTVTSDLLAQCIRHLKEMSVILAEKTAAEKLRQDKYAGSDISGDANKIQNDYISARDRLKDYRAIVQTKRQQSATYKASVEGAAARIEAPLRALGYTEIASALSDILVDEEYKQLSAAREQLATEHTTLAATLAKLTTDLQGQQLPDDPDITVAGLTATIGQLEAERDGLNNHIGVLNEQLAKNREAHEWRDKERKHLEEMTREATGWLHLGNLIGDATGNKYAKYAQNLSLMHLIRLANRRLTELNDRYILDVTDIESDLTIIDLYQGRTKRSVKTLSGGETFVVSLAMALSLSDMASENVRLDSLFIDEGFGSLDAEMLETAIETLEKLQSESGRMIGVISHVESLKERITTQIQVRKSEQGYSTLVKGDMNNVLV